MPLNVEPQDFGRKRHERREAFRSAKAIKSLEDIATAVQEQLDALGYGVVGFAKSENDHTPFTAVEDVDGLSVAFTASSDRMYRIEWAAPFPTSTTGGDRVRMTVTDGSNTILGTSQSVVATSTTTTDSIFGSVIRDDLDGATTVKVRTQISGAGTGTLHASSNTPNWLLVEDIGPNLQAFFLLLEDGDHLLLETGDKIVLE